MWCNTLLQCVVWWITSGADDEQYRGKNGLARGVLELVRCVLLGPDLSLSLFLSLANRPSPLAMWVAGPIYRGLGPLPKYRAGREPTLAAYLRGDN